MYKIEIVIIDFISEELKWDVVAWERISPMNHIVNVTFMGFILKLWYL